MCGSEREKDEERNGSRRRVGCHMNKWEIWDSQGCMSYKPQESEKKRKGERKKETQWPAWARGCRWDIQASRSQTAEVRLGLRRPNPVHERLTNRQTTHGRPKSLILPEALHLQPITEENTSAVKYLHQSQSSQSRLAKNKTFPFWTQAREIHSAISLKHTDYYCPTHSNQYEALIPAVGELKCRPNS